MDVRGTPVTLIVGGTGSFNDSNEHPGANASDASNVGESHRRWHSRLRVWGVGAVLSLLAVAVAGCASGTTPASSSSPSSIASSSASPTTKTSISPSYPAGKEQICQARDQLKTSITTLTDQKLLTAGTTAIKASVDQVQSDFDAVKVAGKQDYQAQVSDMQDALQQLQTAVGDLGNGETASNLRAVGTAITATGAAAEDLFTQLKTTCDS